MTATQSIFEIHPLDKSFDRSNFNCGTPALNDFLKSKARQNQEVGANRTFVAITAGDKNKKVVGFYSQSMAEVNLSSLPEEQRKKLPKHPIPVARIGRLGVDQSTIGQGLGKLLLVDALKRIKGVSAEIGVYAVIVDAKDSSAKSFYQKFGFVEFVDEPMTLFLPVASIP